MEYIMKTLTAIEIGFTPTLRSKVSAGLLGRKAGSTTTRIKNAIWAGFAHVSQPIRRRHFAHVNIPR